MKTCEHCNQPSPTETCDECSTSGVGYNDLTNTMKDWGKRFDEFNIIVEHSNGKEFSLLNTEEAKLVKQFISEEIAEAKEEKSSTYKSSKMYSMGHKDGKEEERQRLLDALPEEKHCELCDFPQPECSCSGFNWCLDKIKELNEI